MKRPSRRLRESATTTLKNGRFLAPPRASLMTTMAGFASNTRLAEESLEFYDEIAPARKVGNAGPHWRRRSRGPRGAGDVQRMPGRSPFIPRSIFCMPPLATIFIIFCVCSNWLSSWFTSCTDTPAPAAIRRLRDAFRISGFARSAGRHRVDDALDARDLPLVDRSRPAPRARAPPAACPASPTARPSCASARSAP